MTSLKLKDVEILPHFGVSQITGKLKASSDGFQYSASGELVDVAYANIKHAILRPLGNRTNLLHLHLRQAMMVGNRRTKDVQLYQSESNKLQSFVQRVSREFVFVFEQPSEDFEFEGSIRRVLYRFVATPSCLLNVAETPLVVSLNDIEIVSLERVGLEQPDFDLVIVFKNLSKNVILIECIASSLLNSIVNWLNRISINYYRSRINKPWRFILDTVIQEGRQFKEDGGWENVFFDDSDDDGGVGGEIGRNSE